MCSAVLDFGGVVGMIVMESDDDASVGLFVDADVDFADVVDVDIVDVADAVSVDAVVKLNVDVEGSRDDADDEVLLFNAHTLPPWHSYPNGQHE